MIWDPPSEPPGADEFDQMVEEWRIKAERLDAVILYAEMQKNAWRDLRHPRTEFHDGHASACASILKIAKGEN